MVQAFHGRTVRDRFFEQAVVGRVDHTFAAVHVYTLDDTVSDCVAFPFVFAVSQFFAQHMEKGQGESDILEGDTKDTHRVPDDEDAVCTEKNAPFL